MSVYFSVNFFYPSSYLSLMPGFQPSHCNKDLKLGAPCHIANKGCYYSKGGLLDLKGDALSTNATLPPTATKTKHEK